MSSLPEVNEVRQRIESCKVKKYQMFLKAEYLFGARAIEIAGKLTSSDKIFGHLTKAIGPTGNDVWLSDTDPPDMQNIDFVKILMKVVTALVVQTNVQQTVLEINNTIEELTKKIPVAVFKIRIAKQHQEVGEEVPFRLFALPLNDRFEPWAKELYEYFKAAGNNYVFPFNRQEVWEYLTRKDDVFKDLTYRIKKYVKCTIETEIGTIEDLKATNPKLYEELIEASVNAQGLFVVCEGDYEYQLTCNGRLNRRESIAVFSHQHVLKNQGLRHVRTHELITDYGFDGIDLGASIGWSMQASQKISTIPVQAGTYAEIREAWKRYIKKLCRKNLNNVSYLPVDH